MLALLVEGAPERTPALTPNLGLSKGRHCHSEHHAYANSRESGLC